MINVVYMRLESWPWNNLAFQRIPLTNCMDGTVSALFKGKMNNIQKSNKLFFGSVLSVEIVPKSDFSHIFTQSSQVALANKFKYPRSSSGCWLASEPFMSLLSEATTG